MKGWRMAMAVGLVFAAQTALADQAKTRESGSSGSSKSSGSSGSSASSTAGERHHSSESGASSHSKGSGRAHESSSPRSSRVSEAAPRPLTAAERRRPRPGTGTGDRHYPYGGYGSRYGYGYGYNPYSYGFGYQPYYGYYGYWGFSPWYYGSSSDWGWGGYSRWPGAYGGYNRYRSRYDDDLGSLRVLVEPEETKVYVDGYYAGVVDDFDGIFQRLRVAPGRHEVTFKLQGYQTHRVKVYVPRDDTLKIHHRMVKGSEGQVTEENMVRPGDEARERSARARYSRPERVQRDEDADDDEAAEADDEDAGTVRLDVEPRDASVYIDGEFRGAGRELRRLELPPGRHRIEIVRPGFRTLERDVEVKSGRSEDLEIRLER